MAEVRKFFRGQRPGYFYSRYKNPTVHELEALLAEIQGTEAGIATGSGVSAIFLTLFSLLSAGDEAIYFIESYKPTRIMFEKSFKKFGVKGIRLSLFDEAGILEACQRQQTKLIIFESPTNPQLACPNISFICQTAKEHGVTSILDNTFLAFITIIILASITISTVSQSLPMAIVTVWAV